MARKNHDLTLDYICRELAIELALPLRILKQVTARIFLKILKHMMYGRSVRVKNFGKFCLKFKKSRRLGAVYGTRKEIKSRFRPTCRFAKAAIDIIEETQAEAAELKEKRIINDK